MVGNNKYGGGFKRHEVHVKFHKNSSDGSRLLEGSNGSRLLEGNTRAC
jgi:hypothetical protein